MATRYILSFKWSWSVSWLTLLTFLNTADSNSEIQSCTQSTDGQWTEREDQTRYGSTLQLRNFNP